MQKTQEAAAETEAQRGGAFRFVEQRGIVKAQFAQRIAEVLVIIRTDREQAGVNLRFNLFKAWQRFFRRVAGESQRIADRRAENIFDGANQPAYLAAFQLGTVNLFRREDAQAVGVIHLPGTHHLNFIAFTHGAVFDTHQRDDAEVVIEPGVDDQSLQRRFRIAFRRRNVAHQAFQHVRHANAGLCRTAHRIGSIDTDDVFNFFRHALRIGRRQVNFVQDRNHLQVHFHRRIAVSQRLGFYALPRINHQQSAFTGSKRTRNFIREVDVAGRVDKVQLIGFTIRRFVIEGDALRLDGNTALTFKIHGVQNLGCHFTIGKATANLDNSVRQCRLTVVDVSDD